MRVYLVHSYSEAQLDILFFLSRPACSCLLTQQQKETHLWSDMPRTQVTPDVQKDLRFLKLRDILDPKRHYRKDRISKLVPDQFEIGTVVQGSTEFFQGRVPKREQKTTMTSEVLAREAADGRLKRKYIQIQAAKTRGKKSHYQKLRAQRSRKAKHP